jgi:hypothetical protein
VPPGSCALRHTLRLRRLQRTDNSLTYNKVPLRDLVSQSDCSNSSERLAVPISIQPTPGD